MQQSVLTHIDAIAKWTGTDLFLLNPKSQDPDSIAATYGNSADGKFDKRLRVAIYGDPESSEHAKLRVLVMIDQIVSIHNSNLIAILIVVVAHTQNSSNDRLTA